MTLTTGNQLKAARALAGVDQQQLADFAGVNVNTIRNMEGRGAELINSSVVTVRNVQLALEALGIEFLNHTQPGVRLSMSTERNASLTGKTKGARKNSSQTTAKASKK